MAIVIKVENLSKQYGFGSPVTGTLVYNVLRDFLAGRKLCNITALTG